MADTDTHLPDKVPDIVMKEDVADSNRVEEIPHHGVSLRLAFINIWSMVAAINYGFGASIIASSLGQPTLAAYFDFEHRGNVTGVIGAIASLFCVGGVVGVVLIQAVSDRWGRKWSFFAACL
jgi:MFS family permease